MKAIEFARKYQGAEPVVVLVVGGITALQALMALLLSFGVELTADQTVQIMSLVNIVGGIFISLKARKQVSPYEPESPTVQLSER